MEDVVERAEPEHQSRGHEQRRQRPERRRQRGGDRESERDGAAAEERNRLTVPAIAVRVGQKPAPARERAHEWRQHCRKRQRAEQREKCGSDFHRSETSRGTRGTLDGTSRLQRIHHAGAGAAVSKALGSWRFTRRLTPSTRRVTPATAGGRRLLGALDELEQVAVEGRVLPEKGVVQRRPKLSLSDAQQEQLLGRSERRPPRRIPRHRRAPCRSRGCRTSPSRRPRPWRPRARRPARRG